MHVVANLLQFLKQIPARGPKGSAVDDERRSDDQTAECQ